MIFIGEHDQQNDTQPVGIHKKLKSYTDKFDPLVSGKGMVVPIVILVRI